MITLLGSLAVLVTLGIPIAFALGLSALLYFVVYQPGLLLVVPQRVYSGMDSELMIALPLFMFMGALMNQGGLTARLIDFSTLFLVEDAPALFKQLIDFQIFVPYKIKFPFARLR